MLYHRIREQKERFMLRLASMLMQGKDVDPQMIAYYRGFYAGAEYTASMPAKAAENLERAARELYRESVLEQVETTEQGAEPYA